ncbi:MAG: hypothetical protein PHG48_03035 [Eubacteriales bacterium]|nr:hypothetical protein [Eubacteriales bacterium]
MPQKQNQPNIPEMPMEAITAALKQLGYPEDGIMDAAQRMSWVPMLAADMVEFARMGAPKFDPDTGKTPAALLRPLRDGYTVASLMEDFLQEPTSAFLLGAALITHYEEALGMLEKMIEDGIYVKEPDGRYVNYSVPAAAKYPECPVCGTKLFKNIAYCGVCGSKTGL